MSLTTAFAVFIIIWWLVLFMVLPLGAKAKIDAADVSEGHDAGAPARPQMLRKILITTGISFVVFALFYFAYTGGYINLRPE